MGLFDVFRSKKPVESDNTPVYSSGGVITVKSSKNQSLKTEEYKAGANKPSITTAENSYRTSDLIYSCVDFIASSASQVTLKVEDTDKVGNVIPVKDKKLKKLFDTSPNPYTTWNDFIDIVVKSYLLTGNSFLSLELVGGAYEMWFHQASKVQVVPNTKDYIEGYMYDEKVAYAPNEMCHWKDSIVTNEYYGQGKVQALLDQLLLEAYGTEDLKNFYENSSVGNGVLTSSFPLTADQTELLRKQFREAYGKDGDRHSNIILPNGLDYKAVSLSPKDSMILDSLDISEHRVLQTFHLNPMVLGGKLSSYTTHPELVLRTTFNTAVRPILYKLEAHLTRFLRMATGKDTLKLRFDYDRIPELEDSMSERSANAKTMFSTGLMSLNEARDYVGLPKIEEEGADKHFLASYLFGEGAATVEDWDGQTLNPATSPAGSTDPQGGAPDGTQAES